MPVAPGRLSSAPLPVACEKHQAIAARAIAMPAEPITSSGLRPILVNLVAIGLVDRIGSKPLLVSGSAGMAITLAAMAWCFSQATGSGAELSLPGATGMVALVAANAYVVFFGVSWGPVVWVLLGEMFPNRIRATALAVAASAQWLANFAITSTFPALAEI